MRLLHGIDICNITRNELNNQLANKILTPNELKQYNEINNQQLAKLFLAKYWSMKEAIFKALSPEMITLQQIEIIKKDNIYVWVNKWNNISSFKISTSSQDNYVISSVFGLMK